MSIPLGLFTVEPTSNTADCVKYENILDLCKLTSK